MIDVPGKGRRERRNRERKEYWVAGLRWREIELRNCRIDMEDLHGKVDIRWTR